MTSPRPRQRYSSRVGTGWRAVQKIPCDLFWHVFLKNDFKILSGRRHLQERSVSPWQECFLCKWQLPAQSLGTRDFPAIVFLLFLNLYILCSANIAILCFLYLRMVSQHFKGYTFFIFKLEIKICQSHWNTCKLPEVSHKKNRKQQTRSQHSLARLREQRKSKWATEAAPRGPTFQTAEST